MAHRRRAGFSLVELLVVHHDHRHARRAAAAGRASRPRGRPARQLARTISTRSASACRTITRSTQVFSTGLHRAGVSVVPWPAVCLVGAAAALYRAGAALYGHRFLPALLRGGECRGGGHGGADLLVPQHGRAARRGCRAERPRITAASTARTSPRIRPVGSPKTA